MVKNIFILDGQEKKFSDLFLQDLTEYNVDVFNDYTQIPKNKSYSLGIVLDTTYSHKDIESITRLRKELRPFQTICCYNDSNKIPLRNDLYLTAQKVGIKQFNYGTDMEQIPELIFNHFDEQKRRNSVLVIEDDLVNQEVVKGNLEPLGYDLIMHSSGKVALDEVPKHLQTLDFAIIDLNLKQDQKNGDTYAQRLREMCWEQGHIIPILAHSTRIDQTNFRVEGFDKIFDGYLPKPFDTYFFSKWYTDRDEINRSEVETILDNTNILKQA